MFVAGSSWTKKPGTLSYLAGRKVFEKACLVSSLETPDERGFAVIMLEPLRERTIRERMERAIIAAWMGGKVWSGRPRREERVGLNQVKS